MNFKDKIESDFSGYPYSRTHGLIRSYRFSWKQHVMEIGFENGKLMWYYRVPPDVYSSLSISEDPDTFFKKHIQNKFKSDEYHENDFSDELLLHSTTCLNKLLPYFHIGQYDKVIILCDRIIQKKLDEGMDSSNFSMENMEKAKALCKLGKYSEIIPLLDKQTGIYASHLKIFAYMKMDRLDQAIKLLKRLTKSRGKEGLYVGRFDFSEVHQLFVEMSIISNLKRELTNEEKEVIENIVLKNSTNLDSEFSKLVLKHKEKSVLHLDIDELGKIYQSLKKSNEKLSKYSPFDESRKFIQNLNLANEKDWKKYCISGKKPDNIPLNPKKDYSFEWKGWNDWLGITVRKYLSFNESKKFVSDLVMDSEKEWKLFCKSGKLPANVPSNPKNVYSSDWKDYDDWFGVHDREYLSFEEAKKFVSDLLFDYHSEWKEYCVSGKKPKNIPAKPNVIYQKQWVDWDNWFGAFDRDYLSYEEQKKFVSTLNFESSSDWTEYAKSGKKPKNIPAKPYKYFEKIGMLLFDIYDWFGVNEREYLSFEEAKVYVRNLKFKNFKEYGEWNNSIRPKNIPHNPSYVYREKGWYGYKDWTGTPN